MFLLLIQWLALRLAQILLDFLLEFLTICDRTQTFYKYFVRFTFWASLQSN
ncbi:hypothetical protein CKA32_006850 [Geitlerinema sp. FC II]|nr:hypothetical protein CKA32_006850 [Geitlerinema sp. FC II]